MRREVWLTKKSVEKKINMWTKRLNKIELRIKKIYPKKEKYEKLYNKLQEEQSNIKHMKIAGLNGHLHNMIEKGVDRYKVVRY